MSNLVPFDETEAIILLSVCKFILVCNLSKNSMLDCLSKILKALATSKNRKIDESYRSVSGLNYQTNVMFRFISASTPNADTNYVPKIFLAAVHLSNNDVDKFNKKLWEGLFMSSEKNKQAFLIFLTAQKFQSASNIFWALEKAETYLKNRGVLSSSVYDVLSIETLERFESMIEKDDNFVKKHKGMLCFLEMGFSVMKDFIVSGINCSIDFELKTESLENNHIDATSVPISFIYYNRAVNGLESWADLYVKFMKILWFEKSRQLILYMGKSFVNELSVDIGNINLTKCMRTPKRIADNIFIETDFTYGEVINRIRAILDKTSIPLKRFSITYKQPMTKSSNNSTFSTVFDVEAKTPQKDENISINFPQAECNTIINDINVQVQGYKLDFYKASSMAYTKPVKCCYGEICINTAQNWTELYAKLFSLILERYREDLLSYMEKNFAGGSRMDICGEAMKNRMTRPKLIGRDSDGNSIYIETNLSANDIVDRIKRILEICRISFADVEITYIKKDNTTSHLQHLLSGVSQSHTSVLHSIEPRYDKELVNRCLVLLRESFSNGIKRNAEIAKRKFRNAYFDKYQTDLPDNIDLDDLFCKNALEYDGKFYAISMDLIHFIQEQLQPYPIGSDMLFSYDAFYNKNISQFSLYGIYSAEMMKAVLVREFPDYYYKSNCFSTHRGLSLEQVVTAAYGEDIILTVSELQEKLPYIDVKQIFPVLSRSNSGFVRVTNGTYAIESRIYIAKSDVEKSKRSIEEDIRKLGYSSLKSIIVEESETHNPAVSEKALQLVLFDYYLTENFSRNRNLIKPLGEADSIVNILKNFCRQHKRITLQEVEEYEMEFTGEDTARRSLKAVTDAMIRVSSDTFVDRVDFDTAAIDKAIEPFFNSRKVISLKNVTSFSVFPDVEELAWNSYLLSSYLSHYSERWGYFGEEHKKKSIGAIFDKSLTFESYDDVMAQAVADSGIELTQEEVSFFLRNNEYRLRDADFKGIISKAYQIRMREE